MADENNFDLPDLGNDAQQVPAAAPGTRSR